MPNLENINEFSFEYEPSPEQKERLLLLGKLVENFEENNIQYSVFGGYGLDGLYGSLTRPHNDFDFVIDWKNETEETILSIGFIKEDIEYLDKRVYYHKQSGTKLEIVDLSVAQRMLSVPPVDIIPDHPNASIGELSFCAPSIEIQKLARKVQRKRLPPPLPKSYPHDEALIKALQHKL